MLNDAMSNMAKAIMEGMSQMVTTLSTFWVSMPTANLASQDGLTASPVVGFVNSELGYWTLALAVLSVILGGTRMIWEQRGAPLKDLLRSLLTLTLVSGLGLAVISILVIAADAFSASIIDRATDGKGFAHAMAILVMTNQTGVGVFILIILGLVGLLASLVQIVLMIVRGGMLVILAGILPTTAAFTNTEMGTPVVPESHRLDHRFHSLQARRGHRLRRGLQAHGILGRQRPAGIHYRLRPHDCRPAGAAGTDALRHPDGRSCRFRFRRGSRSGRGGHGHRRCLDGPFRQRTRQRIPHTGQPARPERQRTGQQGHQRQ